MGKPLAGQWKESAMPWSINGREVFAELPDQFPMDTEEILDWAEDQDEISEFILADLREHMPRRTWPTRDSLINEAQNYTWTIPDGGLTPVWGGVTQAGLD
jgi:hypothetical protein